MEKLNGPFKDVIPMLQKYKKSLGYKYDNISNYNYLDRKLYSNNITDLSDSKKIFDVLINEETNVKKKEKNYKALLQLYEFMEILGYKNLYIEKIYPHNDSDFKANIFSIKEVDIFFENIDRISKENSDNLSPIIFRLIYSCGLRINELINIKKSDFSLQNKAITIVKSKNNITRIIPLSDSMFKILHDYFKNIGSKNKKYLFEKNGYPITKVELERTFKKICCFDNMRVHDLRHVFCFHTLDNLYTNNIKTSDIVYPLTVYLGHSSIESTEEYFQLTKEYYHELVEKTQKKFPDIFPKVGDRNE